MRVIWVAALLALTIPLAAWAGDCGRDCGQACAKAGDDCKCRSSHTERCGSIPAPPQECPGIDARCCPHMDFRLLCCRHEDFRLLCGEKCHKPCKTKCKTKCKPISAGSGASWALEI